MVKATLICTVKNEERTIKVLLESIARQTRFPDEIVIVDGGSTDSTVEIIKSYINHFPNIRLIVSQGTNIATGRNIAIKNATYDIIVSTDCGCKLSQKWFENIVKPFEKTPEVDVVSGVYLPWYENEFEEIASYLFFPNVNKLTSESFLPSGRSIAFKKSIWEKVGGYPEWLNTAEDTFFDLNLRKIGAKFALAKDAIVYWRVRSSWAAIFKQFYNYAKGDGIAFLFPLRHFIRYMTVAFLIVALLSNYLNVGFWVFIFMITIFWFKYLNKLKNPSFKRVTTAVWIALAIELGTFFGYITGLLEHIRPKRLDIIYKSERRSETCKFK